MPMRRAANSRPCARRSGDSALDGWARLPYHGPRMAASNSRALAALFLGSVVLASGRALPQGSEVAEAHAVIGSKIVIGDGRVLEKGRLVVRDGVIEAVDDRLEAPADARVLDGTGLTIYPGFFDASLVAGVTAPALASEGVPFDATAAASARMRESHRKGIRPEVAAANLLEVTEEVASQRRQAGIALALFQPPAATIGGRSALAELSGAPRRKVILAADVALAAELQPAPGEGYPVSMMGAISQFRQTLLDADWQRRARQAAKASPTAKLPPFDPLLAALEPALDKTLPVAFEAYSDQEIRRALALSEELGLRPWIVGGTEAWKCASLLASKNIPVLLSLDFGTEPKEPARRDASSRPGRGESRPDSAPESAPASAPAASAPASRPAWPSTDDLSARVRADRKRRYDERVANAAALARAGVRFVITTRGLRGAGELHGALAKAVEKGLSRDAALAALTTAPAELFGASTRAGVLAPGRPAYACVVKGAVGDKDLKTKAIFVGSQRFDFELEEEARPSGDAPPGGRPGGRRRPREADDQQSGAARDERGECGCDDETHGGAR